MKKHTLFKQTGFTLIEILVAMVVSFILIGGVIQLFTSNKQAYRTMDSSSRLQENGRFAMEFLKQDIRKAGFHGCRSRRSISTNISANITGSGGAPDLDLSVFDINGAVKGSDNVGAGTTVGGQTALVGTDLLTIQYGGSCGGNLVGNMNADNANIQLSAPNSCNLQQNWPFMISDCESADVARASSVSGGAPTQTVAHASNVNTSNRLSKAYQADAEIFSLQSVTYFLAENASGVPSLFRRNNVTSLTEELITDIDDFQVLYGQDSLNNDRVADRYLDAATVTNMTDVVSIRINIRARSPNDNVAVNANTVTYNSAAANNLTDKRIRRQYNSTVSLRNRQL